MRRDRAMRSTLGASEYEIGPPVPGQNESPALPDSSLIATQIAAKGRFWEGRNIGFSMSGHLRFCFATCFLFGGLSTAAASPNPFAALFGQTAPAEATAQAQPQAPAEEECLSRPGKSTVPGQHWFYRSDGHRKCWFQAAKDTATSRKPVHSRASEHVAAPKQNQGAPRKREAIADARDELMRTAPAQGPQPAPRPTDLKVVDAAPNPATGAAALVPPVPTVANPAMDQFTPEHPTPPQVDAENLLAATAATTDAAPASVPPPPTTVAVPTADAGSAGPGWMASGLGALLMALGFVSVLSSSRAIRGAVIERLTAGAIFRSDDGAGGDIRLHVAEPSFALRRNTIDRPAIGTALSSTSLARRLG